jgi:hypothetical protein
MTRNGFTRSVTLAMWMAGSAAMLAQSGSITYDGAAETTIAGTILHVVSFSAPDGSVGVHFDFQTPAGLVNVHVAPAMFIGMNNSSFFADDKIAIIGVTVVQDGNKWFVARAVTKDRKTLVLRGDDGKPAWTPAIDGTDGCGVAHPGLPRGTEL